MCNRYVSPEEAKLGWRKLVIIDRILNFLRQIGKRPVAVDLTGEDSVKARLDGDYYVFIPVLGKRRAGGGS